MPNFPDRSAREIIVRTVGEAELLDKPPRGRILRFQKAIWGQGNESWKYETLLKPYLRGCVLHLGLGMGLSMETICSVEAVTEILAYECEQDIVDLFQEEHDDDPRVQVLVCNAHENKPNGSFDSILYELPLDSREAFDQSKTYLSWALGQLNSGGHFILPADDKLQLGLQLINEFPELQNKWVILASKHESLRPQNIWIVVTP